MRRGLRLGLIASCNEVYNAVKSGGNRFYLVMFMLMMFSSGVFGQGTENFTNIPTASTSSSITRTWNGTGGSWTATQARTDQTINGKAINYRNSGVITSPTLTGGIGSITMTTKLPFSDSAGNLTVKVNGTTVGTIPYSTTTQTTTITNVNISADAVITVEGTSARVSVDDLSWTAYSAGFIVTFNSNGGTGTMANQTASVATNLTANTFTRTGYVFAGWATTAGGAVAYADGASFPFTANTTLYAQWTPVYTLTYNGNGNTGGTAPTDSNTYAAAVSAAVLGQGTLTRTGYTFNGWNTLANGLGTAYAAGSTYTIPASNSTLYAQWTINNYSVAYDGNGNTGGAAPAVENGDYNTGITVSNQGSLTRSGYTFEGWNTAANGSGDSYDPADTYTVPASNATLYAQWLSVGPTVGYTGSVSSFSTEYGTPSFAPSITITGNNLTENLTLDMGSMFEYSTDDITYTNTLSIAPSGGTVNATIYLRIKADIPPITTSAFGQLTSSGAIGFVGPSFVTVSPRNLLLIGVGAEDKVYDGTTTAVLDGFPILFGVVGTDSVGFTGPTTGTFNNANAGTNKTVTISDYTLTGLHADRYNLWQPTTITADINRRTLSISDPTIASKVYDGGTASGTVTPGTLSTLVGSETLAVTATGSYPDANAEIGKTATVTYVLADGTNGGLAANYYLAPTGIGTGDIAKANQTITFGTLANKTTGDAPFNLTATASSGLSVTYSSSMPTVAGVSGNTVTVGTAGTAVITASQAGDGNYNAATAVTQDQVVINGPCLSTTFPSTSVPSGWSGNSANATTSAHYQSAPNTRQITSSTNLITATADNPSSISFYVDASGSGGQTGTLAYRIGAGSWNTIGTFTASTTGATETFPLTAAPDLTSTANVSFRFTSSANSIYIDDVEVFCTPPCSTPANPNGSIAATQNCNNTSLAYTHGAGQPVSGVTYYWQTTATGEDTTYPTSSPFTAILDGTYHVRARSTVGDCWSVGTVSQVTDVIEAQAITTQPTNQTVDVGTTAAFTVVASNAAGYQWQVDTGSGWNNVSTGTGGTSASYTTPATTLAMTGYQYKVIVAGTSPCTALESAVRTLTVSPVITYANLQFPTSHSMQEGSTVAIYGRVYAASVTEAAGASGTITAEFGYSLTNSNPNTWTNWTSGSFNTQVGNDDEYTANLGAGLTPGTYYYSTRYRIGAGSYVYGDTNGVWSAAANNGVLTITSNLVDFGNFQFPAAGNIVLGDVHNVYGQVYELGVTEAALSQGAGIIAEAGYSTSNTNPNTWTNWFPATYNNVASGNNDEYMHNIGADFSTNGTYYLAFRYKKTGSTEYVYGGTNGIWNNDNATVNVVAPKEINVRQNLTDIASTGTYDFGNQVTTTSSTAITFTIQNTGGVVLNLSGTPRVDITGSNASDFTINQSTLPATVAPNSSETFTVTFTPSGLGTRTAYLYIANDDSNENPYMIHLSGTGTASMTSNIIANTGFTNSPINYLNYINSDITIANSFELGQFIIQDGGGSPDGDNLATTLSTLSLLVGNVAYLERIALYDGTTEIAELPAAFTTVFTGLSLTATDGGTKTFSIRASFKTAVADNQRIIVTVSGATAATSGSTFGSISASTSSAGLTDNVIQVTADRLAFAQQPSNTSINVAMAPAVTVSANDVNGNRDVDHAGSVSITSTGTLTGSPVAASFSSGLAAFSSLTHTAAATGRTLSAASTGLTGANSNLFDVTTINYVAGDFRSTGNGTWQTTTTGTATWEEFVGPGWVSNGNRPGINSTQLGTKKVYIQHDITLVGNNTAPNVIVLENGVLNTLTVAATFGNLLVKSGGVFNRQGNSSGVSGNFEVENNGTVNFYHTNSNSRSTSIWAGTEKFHPGSNFVIKTLDNLSNFQVIQSNNDVSEYLGACFGNLIIDYSAGSSLWLLPSGFNKKLTHNDLIFRTANGDVRLSNESYTTTVGGNLIVENTYSNRKANLYSGASGTGNLTIKGDLIHDGNDNINLNTQNGGTINLSLEGDLHIGSNSKLISASTTNSNFDFSGAGDGLTPATTQTIDVVNQLTASNILFTIKRGAYAKLMNQSFALGTGSSLAIESGATATSNGGTLDFGFNSSNNGLTVTGPSFESKAGSILKITSDAGIASAGTNAGNVQTTARTYTALGDFHYIGKTNQTTGTGLPSNVRNLTIHNESSSSDVTLTNTVAVNNILTMTKGNIKTLANRLDLGINTTTRGTLDHTEGVVKGTMLRWFSASDNSGAATGLFPMGTAANLKRFATLEYTAAPTLGGSVTAVLNETPMGNTGLASLTPVPLTGGCPSFSVLSTDDSFWKLTPATLTGGTFTLTLRKQSGSTVEVCKQTLLKRDLLDWTKPGTHVEPSGAATDIIVSRSGLSGLMNDFGLGNANCPASSIVYNGSWPGSVLPTFLDTVEFTEDFPLDNGIVQMCECKVVAGKTVTIASGATLQLMNGINIESGLNPDGSEDGKLIIEDGGSLVQLVDIDNATANNNTGNIQMVRITKPMYRYDFTYWSSPVFANDDQSDDAASVLAGTEFNLKKLSPMTLFDKYYKWNHAATAPGWQTIPVGAESMVPGRGYIVRAPQTYGTDPADPGSYVPYNANFIGVPNNGIVRHDVSGPDVWNLLGNPYPSAISADAFFDANVGAANGSTDTLEGSIYLWTHNSEITETGTTGIYTYSNGDYACYNGTGSTDTKEADTDPTPGDPDDNKPTGYIAAGQSFFIKGTAAGEAVFNNGMRVAGQNNQFFRPAPTEPLNNWDTDGKHRVWLNMKGQTKGFNQLLVGYVGNATNGWDVRFDGESFGGNQVTFYSLLENKRLTIQGRALPFNNQDEVPLGYRSTLNGTLTISIDGYDGLFEGQGIYLEDKVLDIVHDLKASAYNFTTVIGTFNERFVLRYLPSGELGNPDHGNIANGLIVYQEENKIMIKSQLQDLEQVTIYDLLGRIVFDKTTIHKNEFGIENVVMNEQPLIIKVKLANGQIVNRKIVY